MSWSFSCLVVTGYLRATSLVAVLATLHLNTDATIAGATIVSQGDLLLIVEPVLIIGTKARIKDPLLKAKIALRKVLRDRVSFRGTRVPCEIGNAGDDSAASVFNHPLRLIGEHFSCHAEE